MPEAKPKEVVYFENDEGISPFEEWLEELRRTDSAAERIDTRLRRVAKGNLGEWRPVKCNKGISGVSELVLDFGPGYRIYFGQVADMIVILQAGKKSSQQADIKLACARWKEYTEG